MHSQECALNFAATTVIFWKGPIGGGRRNSTMFTKNIRVAKLEKNIFFIINNQYIKLSAMNV